MQRFFYVSNVVGDSNKQRPYYDIINFFGKRSFGHFIVRQPIHSFEFFISQVLGNISFKQPNHTFQHSIYPLVKVFSVFEQPVHTFDFWSNQFHEDLPFKQPVRPF